MEVYKSCYTLQLVHNVCPFSNNINVSCVYKYTCMVNQLCYLSTDVASRVFTQCIIPDKVNKSLEYNYYFLEEHIKQNVDEAVSANNSRRTPPTQTPGTQVTTRTQVTTQATGVHSTGGAPATTQTTQVTTQVTGIQSGTEATTSLTNQLAATNPVVTQTSDPASETPWWLKYKDPKETEKQDDPPSHPLELMVGYMYSTVYRTVHVICRPHCVYIVGVSSEHNHMLIMHSNL